MFARSFRSMFAAAVVALSVVPAAAYADGNTTSTQAGQSQSVRQEKKDKESFPMPTATFKAHWERRIADARTRLDERLVKRGLDGEKLKAAMSKFDAGSAKILGEVDRVGARGTISKENAKDVRAFARGVRLEMHSRAKGPRHAK